MKFISKAFFLTTFFYFILPLFIHAQDFVRIGNLEIQTTDMGELNYYQAKSAIENLGQGWRLPNERELKLMFENQNTIGLLSKKEFKVINGYWRYTGNYLGAESERRYLILRTFVDPGLVLPLPSLPDKQSFYFVRAVREVPEVTKATRVVASQKSNPVQKKAVPQTYKKTLYKYSCALCGKSYLGNGFGYRIVEQAGKRKLEVHEARGDDMRAFNIVDNKYDTYEHARQAGEKELYYGF